jgi:hypothetical protein
VVVATNSPFVDIVSIHTKQHAYRTYAIAAGLSNEAAVPPGLYWDTLDPYHYVRRYGETLIVGGEDHKTGQEEIRRSSFVGWNDGHASVFRSPQCSSDGRVRYWRRWMVSHTSDWILEE